MRSWLENKKNSSPRRFDSIPGKGCGVSKENMCEKGYMCVAESRNRGEYRVNSRCRGKDGGMMSRLCLFPVKAMG